MNDSDMTLVWIVLAAVALTFLVLKLTNRHRRAGRTQVSVESSDTHYDLSFDGGGGGDGGGGD